MCHFGQLHTIGKAYMSQHWMRDCHVPRIILHGIIVHMVGIHDEFIYDVLLYMVHPTESHDTSKLNFLFLYKKIKTKHLEFYWGY